MQVKDFMTRGVVTIAPDTTLLAAAKLMLEHRVGGLPVLDAAGRIIGVFSESDLLREEGEDGSPWLDIMVAQDEKPAASLRLEVHKEDFEKANELIESVHHALEAFAVFEGVKWIKEMFDQTEESAIATKHLSDRLGIATDDIQKFQYAADISGASQPAFAPTSTAIAASPPRCAPKRRRWRVRPNWRTAACRRSWPSGASGKTAGRVPPRRSPPSKPASPRSQPSAPNSTTRRHCSRKSAAR